MYSEGHSLFDGVYVQGVRVKVKLFCVVMYRASVKYDKRMRAEVRVRD